MDHLLLQKITEIFRSYQIVTHTFKLSAWLHVSVNVITEFGCLLYFYCMHLVS